MKKLLFLLPVLLFVQAFHLVAQTTKGSGDQVSLTCKIISPPGNAKHITLYEQIGMAYREVARGAQQADKSYLLKIPMSEPRIYSIGFNENQNGRIILGKEKELTLWANAQFMEKGRTMGSEINKSYENARKKMAELKTKSEALRIKLRQFRSAKNAELAKTTLVDLKALEKEKVAFLVSLKKENPLFWRSATLQLSPDFTKEQAGNSGELEFYSKEFFGYADLSDPAYEETPDVFDAFETYVLTVSQLGASTTAASAMVKEQLGKLKKGTNVKRRALAGAVSGLKKANHPDYNTFARHYVDAYRSKDLGEIARLEYDLKRSSTFTPGMEAPDLAGNTPEGTPYALSKMRGKYVLIDFWASWCGPCRRENPNVVAMYNRYKEKGFDILGVSLDRKEAAWKKAIAQDGLKWHHISDLKGWKSDHAKLYSVTSIPQTLLIGPDGKIIQRNLRGPQLGAKLKEIFGE